jgi:hypothetical protein
MAITGNVILNLRNDNPNKAEKKPISSILKLVKAKIPKIKIIGKK